MSGRSQGDIIAGTASGVDTHDVGVIAKQDKSNEETSGCGSGTSIVKQAAGKRKERNSNLELYRIIVMLLIVAHHYVVNSGLNDVLKESSPSITASAMLLFGAWGKTGIDCFVLITGYFMCKMRFSWQKLLKLYMQVAFYGVIISFVFVLFGEEQFSFYGILSKLWPVRTIGDDFTSAFMVFYLLVPFINILLANMSKRQHGLLTTVLVFFFTIMPTYPGFELKFNYVEWFVVVYMIASYLRFYGGSFKISHRVWGVLSLISLTTASASVLGIEMLYRKGIMSEFTPYMFISDSNKLFALMVSVCTFMWFKDLKIRQMRLINVVGSTTFGVLLIHSNSGTMRRWLWRDTIDCVGHYGSSLTETFTYAVVSVLLIFSICSFIDWLRICLLEKTVINVFISKIESCMIRRAI